MAVPFISSADLEDHLGYTLDPDKAVIAVDSACDMLRKVSEQQLDYVADDVVVLDSDGSDTLLLPEGPVVSVTSVSGPGTDVMVTGEDYVFDKEMAALRTAKYRRHFLRGRQLYTVTYTHGYTNDLTGKPAGTQLWPASLRALALTVAARLYDQGGVSQESVGGYTATFSSPEALTLTDRERDLLDKIVGVARRRMV